MVELLLFTLYVNYLDGGFVDHMKVGGWTDNAEEEVTDEDNAQRSGR